MKTTIIYIYNNERYTEREMYNLLKQRELEILQLCFYVCTGRGKFPMNRQMYASRKRPTKGILERIINFFIGKKKKDQVIREIEVDYNNERQMNAIYERLEYKINRYR